MNFEAERYWEIKFIETKKGCDKCGRKNTSF